MAGSDPQPGIFRQVDLDRCIHCGLCLNACPTYRELGLEMDSPRGRLYQMARVAEGAALTPSYVNHIGLCLGCRGCESACPSGVPYGRILEQARAGIESHAERGWLARRLRQFLLMQVMASRTGMSIAGVILYLMDASGMRAALRGLGSLGMFGRLGRLAQLMPKAEPPFFFSQTGRTFAPVTRARYRVAFLTGCVANVCYARLNEATVRVLQRNGCEIVIPEGQTCCGAAHAHSGLLEEARGLARRNIDAVLAGDFDVILSNAAGCGAQLKEYGELLAGDPVYAERAKRFSSLVCDITEFLEAIGLNRAMGDVNAVATYQDSCHLAHGQKIRSAPRELLALTPGLTLREMSYSDVCCGSAGTYNIVQNEMSMKILARKMEAINATGAQIIATANPGCMLQLEAGVRMHGNGQRVMHVVEILDLAYRNRV
jgi:glycolate oxidase iron-sulfur subunit